MGKLFGKFGEAKGKLKGRSKAAAAAQSGKEKKSDLKEICEKHGKPELYEPLYHTMCLNPEEYVKNVFDEAPVCEFLMRGSMLLYKTKDTTEEEKRVLLEGAKGCFAYGAKFSKERELKTYMRKVAKDIEAATDILVECWVTDGKYKELEEKA